MPDPALLDLMHHLSWQPPAIVRPAVVASASGAGASFEKFVERSEAEVDEWALRGSDLRRVFWDRTVAGGNDIDVQTAFVMLEQFELALKVEARMVARFKKEVRRDLRVVAPSYRDDAKRLTDRMIAASERFFEQGLDFALFLRALRAEMDPDSHGGQTFEDPDTLTRYLLSEAV